MTWEMQPYSSCLAIIIGDSPFLFAIIIHYDSLLLTISMVETTIEAYHYPTITNQVTIMMQPFPVVLRTISLPWYQPVSP